MNDKPLPIHVLDGPKKLLRIIPMQLQARATLGEQSIKTLESETVEFSQGERFHLLGYNLEVEFSSRQYGADGHLIPSGKENIIRENGFLSVQFSNLSLPPVALSQIPPMFIRECNLVDESNLSAEARADVRALQAKHDVLIKAERTAHHPVEVGIYRCTLRMSECFKLVYNFPNSITIVGGAVLKGYLNGLCFKEA